MRQLCTYHWGLIGRGRTTYEDIRKARRHFPGGVEPTRSENCRAFFVGTQRPSYVGTDGGLLAASGDIDMQEVAQDKMDVAADMEAFAAGRGHLAIAASGGSSRSTNDVSGEPHHQDQAEDKDSSSHNPLPT